MIAARSSCWVRKSVFTCSWFPRTAPNLLEGICVFLSTILVLPVSVTPRGATDVISFKLIWDRESTRNDSVSRQQTNSFSAHGERLQSSDRPRRFGLASAWMSANQSSALEPQGSLEPKRRRNLDRAETCKSRIPYYNTPPRTPISEPFRPVTDQTDSESTEYNQDSRLPR